MDVLEVRNIEDLAIAPKANAFRVLDDGNGVDCFLDFLEYDLDKNIASVVSRIQINRGFLLVIRDRLTLSLKEITKETNETAEGG